jgi:hypothetical protein
MKNTFIVILLVLLPCLIVGCQQGERALVQPISEPAADVEADIQAIKDIIEQGEFGLNTGDIDRLMRLTQTIW